MLEEQNPDSRSKFIELLGDSKVPKVIPYLAKELEHSQREVRSWTYLTLDHFGTPEATQLAETFRLVHPHEDFL